MAVAVADPYHRFEGGEPLFSYSHFFRNLLLGSVLVQPWERNDSIVYPTIGLWNSSTFVPDRFQFSAPNMATVNMTFLDAYWGARIVSAFTDNHIDELVKTAQYSNPKAAAYSARILKERRDKIMSYYFKNVAPLDSFALTQQNDSLYIHFIDLALRNNVTSAQKKTSYRYYFPEESNKIFLYRKPVTHTGVIPLQRNSIPFSDKNISLLRIEVKRNSKRSWSDPIDVYFQKKPSGNILLAGIKR